MKNTTEGLQLSWRPGTDARQRESLYWEARRVSHQQATAVHRAVMEKTGFVTRCGLTIPYKRAECRPLNRTLLPHGRCYRCYPV